MKGTLRINAQAVDLKKARRGPEYAEIGPLEDLARLQSHLAWQTLQFVLRTASPLKNSSGRRQSVVRVDAIESYIRGLAGDLTRQKLKYFSQAVRLDPEYSHGNFELGRLHFQRKSYRPAADLLQKVAVSDVHSSARRLSCSAWRDSIWAISRRRSAHFSSVAQQVPLNEVLNNLGAAQSRLNQQATAIDNFKKALEGDSSDPVTTSMSGTRCCSRAISMRPPRGFVPCSIAIPDDAEATTHARTLFEEGSP